MKLPLKPILVKMQELLDKSILKSDHCFYPVGYTNYNILCLVIKLPNNVWRLIVFAPFLIIIIIIITSPRTQSGDILLFYVSFSLLLLLFLLLFFYTFLFARFLGDALIKLYETLQKYHMPCEVVLVRVDFFEMAAVAMETNKMIKN